MNRPIRSVRWPLATAAFLAVAGVAHAQHADFVLFGKPNPDAAAAPAENRFVHPLTGPYYHEDSFITSDVRAWFVYHNVRDDIALGGGDAFVAALQLRLAITDRIQLVAYKDGFIWLDTPLINQDGWNDIAAGLKFAAIQDYKENFHWSLGAGYEFPWGDNKVLQNDGEVRLWTSLDKGFGPFHIGATFNYFFPTSGRNDDFGNGQHLSWHLHADYRVCDWFSPVLEFNGYHQLTGNDSGLAFHGADVGNLGNGLGDPAITAAVGVEFRPVEKLGLRGAFEFPLNSTDQQLFGWRLTFSIVYSF